MLKKTVVNDNGGKLTQADFPSFLDGSPLAWDTQVEVMANEEHTASETPQTGYTASAWGGDCAADGTITLLPGDVKECTITNDDIRPQLTVIKHVVNIFDEPAEASDWTMDVTATNPDQASFPGAEAPGTTIGVNAGAYSVDESGGPSGYSKSLSADCSGTIAVGENKTCTITNTRVLHPGTIGFWKNWRNHYSSRQFNLLLIDYVRTQNPTIYRRLDIARVDAIFDFGKKTPRNQMILAQLTGLKFNLAVTQLDGTGGIVQKNDDICLNTRVDVSGISGAARFFEASELTIEDVIDKVEPTWTGMLTLRRRNWTFSLTKAQQNIVIKVLTGINEGDIIIDPGCLPPTP